jgi:2-amino-4-hydroxy-6-hydroxymethyldihydropteridine diphosphokinase
MVTAYVGLGCNLGNCRKNLQQAWTMLGEVKGVKLLILSNPYISEPVGMESKNWFINAVGSLQTSLQPEELLVKMQAVEAGLGRKRGLQGKPEDRTIDLDLLYWGTRVNDEPNLVLPHPEIANRFFVLFPLAEIGPELVHPAFKKTSAEMLQECKAKQQKAGSALQVQLTSWSIENCEERG